MVTAGPSLSGPNSCHPCLASGGASCLAGVADRAPSAKRGSDSQALENRRPIQGAGLGGPCFRCMISARGNPVGLPKGLIKPSMTPCGGRRSRAPGFPGLANTPLHGQTFKSRKGCRWLGPQSIQAASGVSTLDSKPRRHWGPDPTKCPGYLVGPGRASPLSSCSAGHSSHFAPVTWLW